MTLCPSISDFWVQIIHPSKLKYLIHTYKSTYLNQNITGIVSIYAGFCCYSFLLCVVHATVIDAVMLSPTGMLPIFVQVPSDYVWICTYHLETWRGDSNGYHKSPSAPQSRRWWHLSHHTPTTSLANNRLALAHTASSWWLLDELACTPADEFWTTSTGQHTLAGESALKRLYAHCLCFRFTVLLKHE